jgi:hypothetical protein
MFSEKDEKDKFACSRPNAKNNYVLCFQDDRDYSLLLTKNPLIETGGRCPKMNSREPAHTHGWTMSGAAKPEAPSN